MLSPYRTIALLMAIMIVLIAFDGRAQSKQTLIIEDDFRYTQTSASMMFIEDENSKLSAAQVFAIDNEKWQLANSPSLNLGISDSTFWFKISFQNRASTKQSLVLLNSYAALDYVDLFVLRNEHEISQHIQSGDMRTHDLRPLPHPSFAFPIELSAGEEVNALIKIKSAGNLIVPVSVWSAQEFAQYQINFYLIFGLLLGVLIITSLYNVFVSFNTKEKLFFSFSAFILTVSFLVMIQSGLGMQFLWPESPDWNAFLPGFAIAFATVGHLVFSVHFLKIKSLLLTVCYAIAIASLCIACLYAFIPYAAIVQSTLLLGTAALMLPLIYAGIRTMQEDESARLYLIAWTPFGIGVIVSAAIRFKLIDYSIYTEFAGLFFAVITIVWLSVAISKRINQEKLKRIRAQRNAITNLERYEDLFENAVEGIFTTTFDRKVVRANDALVRMFAYPDKNALLNGLSSNLDSLYKNPLDRSRLLHKALKYGKVIDEEIELVKYDGTPFWASVTFRTRLMHAQNSEETAAQSPDNAVFEGSLIDITERKLTEQKLRHFASHDPLTKINNRREFENRLQHSIDATHSDSKVYVMYIDLDKFKVVNDTFGHNVGDKLLVEISDIMSKTLSQDSVLARLGGDEFGIILFEQNSELAFERAQAVLEAISSYRFSHQQRVFSVGVSIGLVELSESLNNIEDVMSFADSACYAAKKSGRNQIRVYSSDSAEFSQHRDEVALATLINDALSRHTFTLYTQKLVRNDKQQSFYGYEMLLRMLCEGKERDIRELYSPGYFIPVAEKYGLMAKVDQWVIEHSFEWLSEQGNAIKEIERCSINLSGQSIGSEALKQRIIQCFERFKIPHNKICFEITETHAIENIDQTIEFMGYFQQRGCQFSLDDFGSGLSSYGYLKTLPIDNIKIDGRFVQGIAADSVDYAMVESIQAVAHAMGKKTIAEYVENEEIIAELKKIGVDVLQGYAIEKPKPAWTDIVSPSNANFNVESTAKTRNQKY
ncbi:EAL domain-containing protein [Ningiella sp. W23]|uniref:EAL domain-containing protein n=1 Tax=Ningiella sp. W23 TaxID=3023715 RepID=UPI003756B9DE